MSKSPTISDVRSSLGNLIGYLDFIEKKIDTGDRNNIEETKRYGEMVKTWWNTNKKQMDGLINRHLDHVIEGSIPPSPRIFSVTPTIPVTPPISLSSKSITEETKLSPPKVKRGICDDGLEREQIVSELIKNYPKDHINIIGDDFIPELQRLLCYVYSKIEEDPVKFYSNLHGLNFTVYEKTFELLKFGSGKNISSETINKIINSLLRMILNTIAETYGSENIETILLYKVILDTPVLSNLLKDELNPLMRFLASPVINYKPISDILVKQGEGWIRFTTGAYWSLLKMGETFLAELKAHSLESLSKRALESLVDKSDLSQVEIARTRPGEVLLSRWYLNLIHNLLKSPKDIYQYDDIISSLKNEPKLLGSNSHLLD